MRSQEISKHHQQKVLCPEAQEPGTYWFMESHSAGDEECLSSYVILLEVEEEARPPTVSGLFKTKHHRHPAPGPSVMGKYPSTLCLFPHYL